MKMYFRLHEECFLIPDRDGTGAIYNVFDGNIYRISDKEASILEILENNESINDVLNKMPDITKEFLISKLNLYKENEIGTFYSKPVYINKLLIDYKAMESIPATSSIILTRAIISLSNECRQDCKFCYPAQYIGDNTCVCCSGMEKKSIQQYMEIEKLEKILSAIEKLKCRNIVLKIPDIEVNAEYFFRCLDVATEYTFENITIMLGNTSMCEDTLRNLLRYNINLIVQKEVKDEDIELALNIYKDLKNMKDNSKISLLYIVYGDEVRDKLLKEINILNGSGVNCIISRYMKKEEAVNYYLKNPKFVKRTSIETFSYNQYFHPCLGGLIYFDQSGDVYPCPNLLDFKMGNIDNFREVWNKEGLHKFWHLTSIDNIDKCKTCAIRYACNDCRANEYLLGGELLSKMTCGKA